MTSGIRTRSKSKQPKIPIGKKTFTVRLPDYFVDEIDGIISTGACGIYHSRSEFIELALKHYIDCNGATSNE